MTGSLGRRGFLVGAGALGLGWATAAGGRRPDPPAFTGADTFDRLVARARDGRWSELPIGERMAAIGLALRGTPYVDQTLELYDDREVCSINFRGLDCVTFFETCLGFARMLTRPARTPGALLQEVTFTRYRGGEITDYASRLHYTTDWFADNEAKGVVRLITRELPGATRFAKRIDFMSTHPEAYRQLRGDPGMVRKIQAVEAQINTRAMDYVPKAGVRAASARLATGDIVGITTSLEGLDCGHVGLAYRDGGTLRLLHASTTQKKVVLDEELATYLAQVPTHTGIMVARPLDPAR
jgi:hypothetical protein